MYNSEAPPAPAETLLDVDVELCETTEDVLTIMWNSDNYVLAIRCVNINENGCKRVNVRNYVIRVSVLSNEVCGAKGGFEYSILVASSTRLLGRGLHRIHFRKGLALLWSNTGGFGRYEDAQSNYIRGVSITANLFILAPH